MDSEHNHIYNEKDWLGNTLLTWDGDTGEINYQYNDNGNIIEKMDEKGNVITYHYDACNRIVRKDLPGDNFIYYYYDGYDELTGIPLSGDHGECLGKLTRVVLANGIDGENYTYDSRGRITKIGKIIDGEQRFLEKEYDSLNRVVKEILPGGEDEYDRINNIIEKDGYEYQYHEDKPHAVIFDGRNTYTYDANGNMIQAAGHSTITIRAKGTGVIEEPPVMDYGLPVRKKQNGL